MDVQRRPRIEVGMCELEIFQQSRNGLLGDGTVLTFDVVNNRRVRMSIRKKPYFLLANIY